MKSLILVVTKEWFDKIQSKEKNEDFREIKAYWEKRLEGKEYDRVEIVNGYGKSRPRMFFKWNGFRVTGEKEQTDLGIGSFYAISLKEHISSENIPKESV